MEQGLGATATNALMHHARRISSEIQALTTVSLRVLAGQMLFCLLCLK